jgi:hypothetical protein
MAVTDKRKRSKQVQRGPVRWPWVTAGAVGVLAIGGALLSSGPEQPLARDQYASLEDCQADWGGDAGICDQTGDAAAAQTSGSTSSSHTSSTGSSFTSGSGVRSYWYGPMYSPGDRDGAIRQAWSGKGVSNFTPGNRSIGRTSVSRGGFGSSSHSFSSHSSSSS